MTSSAESTLQYEHERQRSRLATLRDKRSRPINDERLHLFPQPKTDHGIPPTLLKQYLRNRQRFTPAVKAFQDAKKQFYVWRNAGKLQPMDLAIIQRREQKMATEPTQIHKSNGIPIGRQAELHNMAIEILDNPKRIGDWQSFWEMPDTGSGSKEEFLCMLSKLYEETRKHVSATVIQRLRLDQEDMVRAGKEQKEENKKRVIQKGLQDPREFKKTLVKTSDGDKELASLRKQCVTLGCDLPTNFMELGKSELKQLIKDSF